MQSQQKRVKWSRGETAEALEERTDTGITSASVELMENCIPDIYGNISRRPSIKALPISSTFYAHSSYCGFEYDPYLQVIPFYFSENDVILIGIHLSSPMESIRIKNGELVRYVRVSSSGPGWPKTGIETDTPGVYTYNGPVSYAQQNNYMIISDGTNTWQISYTATQNNGFMLYLAPWNFTGGWYAPNGTQTKTETSITIPGLTFSGTAQNYAYTSSSGESATYTSLPTGLSKKHGFVNWTGATTTFYLYLLSPSLEYVITTSDPGTGIMLASWTMTNGQKYEDSQVLYETAAIRIYLDIQSSSVARFVAEWDDGNNWASAATYNCSTYVFISYRDSWTALTTRIPAGSIVKMPNIGCYMRVEGYYSLASNTFFPGVVFDKVVTLANGADLPSGYTTGTVCVARTTNGDMHLEYWQEGTLVSRYPTGMQPADTMVYVQCVNSLSASGQKGGKFHYENHGWHFTWDDALWDTQDIYIFGSLLTPIADSNATDNVVSVEYGYVSLNPAVDWEETFPHPLKLLFSGQRLWAGSWAFSTAEQYSIVIGSQIGRYNDFKNDYNQENEPVTLDILTQYRERILHLVDYNGLKIMTDSYEYAYDGTNGVVKQSANGSFEYCEPIVFDSLCLYVDSTGQQVKAMQYEFQSNIFNSSTINQVAPHDLIWNPLSLSSYEDKTNSTGKYLFVVNEYNSTNPRLAVCNFVPSNQANIWSRWSMPDITVSNVSVNPVPLIHNIVHTKTKPYFLVTTMASGLTNVNDRRLQVTVCNLDFDKNTDLEGIVTTVDGVNYYTIQYYNATINSRLPNTEVAVYANGVFQWLDTTTSTGALTKSIEGLTNVTVGLPINSTIVSHPIDVGGKTKSIKKRIGKARMSVHGTEADVITINGKTGYMNPAKDQISFYGVTGMKNEIKYTITNKNGGMFHLESLLMNIEYGTLDS